MYTVTVTGWHMVTIYLIQSGTERKWPYNVSKSSTCPESQRIYFMCEHMYEHLMFVVHRHIYTNGRIDGTVVDIVICLSRTH